jgi:hypothetical protein
MLTKNPVGVMKGTGLSYIFICEIGNVKLDCHVYDLIV